MHKTITKVLSISAGWNIMVFLLDRGHQFTKSEAIVKKFILQEFRNVHYIRTPKLDSRNLLLLLTWKIAKLKKIKGGGGEFL